MTILGAVSSGGIRDERPTPVLAGALAASAVLAAASHAAAAASPRLRAARAWRRGSGWRTASACPSGRDRGAAMCRYRGLNPAATALRLRSFSAADRPVGDRLDHDVARSASAREGQDRLPVRRRERDPRHVCVFGRRRCRRPCRAARLPDGHRRASARADCGDHARRGAVDRQAGADGSVSARLTLSLLCVGLAAAVSAGSVYASPRSSSPPRWLANAERQMLDRVFGDARPAHTYRVPYPGEEVVIMSMFDRVIVCESCSAPNNASLPRGRVIRVSFDRRTHLVRMADGLRFCEAAAPPRPWQRVCAGRPRFRTRFAWFPYTCVVASRP